MKTVLILGSNSDVGQACAHKFAAEKFNIILASRNPNDYQDRLASDISIRHQVKCETIYFDALDMEGHKSFYDELSVPPDIVISLFGVLDVQSEAEKDFEVARNTILTNFLGNVSILGAAANEMEQRKKGTIICVSSVAGERGRKSNYIYGSSKAALTAFLSGLRSRLAASNVHVVTVLPGFIDTKMIAGLATPKLLTASSKQVTNAIWKGYQKKKNILYVLPIWRWIMLIIKLIPEFIFKKINL